MDDESLPMGQLSAEDRAHIELERELQRIEDRVGRRGAEAADVERLAELLRLAWAENARLRADLRQVRAAAAGLREAVTALERAYHGPAGELAALDDACDGAPRPGEK